MNPAVFNQIVRRSLAGCFAAALPFASASAQSNGGDLAIGAGRYVRPDGKIEALPGLTIRDGRIASIAAPDAHVARHAYADAVVCPGLIDCLGALGVKAGLTEVNAAVQPELDAADALNAFSGEFAAALRAGVTTVALAPDDRNLVGGRVAVVHVAAGLGRSGVHQRGGAMKLSLSPAAFLVDREPTSRSGAVRMLRDALAAVRDDASAAWRGVLDGERMALAAAPAGADVLAIADLARTYKLRAAVIHSDEADRVATAAGDAIAAAIVGPFDLSTSPRRAAAAREFERATIPVAIGGGLPAAPADSLRIGAAVAARGGLSLPAARRAISAVPAEILGVADLVGSIREGLQADLVVFSGDPVDLRSRVLAVYADGQLVYRAAPEPTDGAHP